MIISRQWNDFSRRLRFTVIKVGLRNITLAYSRFVFLALSSRDPRATECSGHVCTTTLWNRISFSDICKKLNLENPQDAEFICAKVSIWSFIHPRKYIVERSPRLLQLVCCWKNVQFADHSGWSYQCCDRQEKQLLAVPGAYIGIVSSLCGSMIISKVSQWEDFSHARLCISCFRKTQMSTLLWNHAGRSTNASNSASICTTALWRWCLFLPVQMARI